jgi:hypothetical protein
MRRHVVTVLLPRPVADPAYDTYEMVRTDAERKSRGPLGPEDLKSMYEVADRRGNDWCTAVLGHSFPGIDRSSSVDGWMLVLADAMELDPPLPPSVVEARKRRQEHEDLLAQKAKERREREKRRWDAAVAAAGVEMTVRENTRHSGVGRSLRHAAPKDDLVSGRSRKHPADRGLCETPGRSNPLHLSEPVDAPANCHRCLDYMEKVRPADAPAPPTAAEKRLLELIKSGVVFTLRPGRTNQPIVFDTSQRSTAAWGHLGRKVSAAVKKLEAKGWVVVDEQFSRTQADGMGWRWRLTDAGTAALEG